MHYFARHNTQTQNIQKICHKLVEVTEHECPELVPEAKVTEEKFKKLFCLFGECHFKYNSSSPMDETEANALGKTLLQMIVHTTNVVAANLPYLWSTIDKYLCVS